MGLSAIIYKNVSKCCTVQKTMQINHRNIYIRYSIFSACAVCQLITYTPAQGSARKQNIQHDLLAMVSQNCLYLHVSLEYSALHNCTPLASYVSYMTLPGQSQQSKNETASLKRNYKPAWFTEFPQILSQPPNLTWDSDILLFFFVSCNFCLQFLLLLALCWTISSVFRT